MPAVSRVRPRPPCNDASHIFRPRSSRAGNDVTSRYMFAAAGRVAVPKLFGLEHPRTVIQNEPAPIGAREERSDVVHQHPARSSKSRTGRHTNNKAGGPDKGGPRDFEGAAPAPPRARGVQRGTRPGGPLWSRRRRSPQLNGLKSGHRRSHRRRQSWTTSDRRSNRRRQAGRRQADEAIDDIKLAGIKTDEAIDDIKLDSIKTDEAIDNVKS